MTLAQAVGPVGLGVAYDVFGAYEPGFWVVVGGSLVAVAAITWGTRGLTPASAPV